MLAISTGAAAGCSDDSSASDGSNAPTLKCNASAANSGGLCQVNFFCGDGGDGPSAYCDSAGHCKCFKNWEDSQSSSGDWVEFDNPDICDTELDKRARIANEACGFGL